MFVPMASCDNVHVSHSHKITQGSKPKGIDQHFLDEKKKKLQLEKILTPRPGLTVRTEKSEIFGFRHRLSEKE